MTDAPAGPTLPHLVLASASPRRADILRTLGVRFAVRPAHVDETIGPDEAPAVAVRRIAATKAEAVWVPGTVTVAADTVVVAEGRVLGKPTDAEDARRMLRTLDAGHHHVLSGVAVRSANEAGTPYTRTEICTTEVRMRDYTYPEVDWYVATGEPADKAGAYAIQGIGGYFVDSITGNYHNVVGLPVPTLDDLLQKAGHRLLQWVAPPG